MRHLQALCVARHRLLAEHFARFFSEIGIDAATAVGFDGAIVSVQTQVPDIVVCEYDLLATVPLDMWEQDAVLRHTPVVAVSLTRRPDEMHPLDVNGIAGFLYLPTLRPADAHRLLHAAAIRPSSPPGSTGQSRTTSSIITPLGTPTDTLGAP